MESMRLISKKPKVRILKMRNVTTLDATGLNALKDGFLQSKKQGVHFFIEGIHTQPLVTCERSGFLEMVGEDNLFGSLEEALEKAREIIAKPT